MAPSRVPRLAGSYGGRDERVAQKSCCKLAGVAPETVPRGTLMPCQTEPKRTHGTDGGHEEPVENATSTRQWRNATARGEALSKKPVVILKEICRGKKAYPWHRPGCHGSQVLTEEGMKGLLKRHASSSQAWHPGRCHAEPFRQGHGTDSTCHAEPFRRAYRNR